MAFSKFLSNSARGNLSGVAKTVVAAPKPINYPPVVSSSQTNQLAPGGAVSSAPVKNVPRATFLNDTATAFNTPIPPGGAPTRKTFLRR